MAVRGMAALTLAVGLTAAVAGAAQAETRSLKLYFVHTGERATITFKRNGKFDADGLAKLNRFLRDWRRNEPTKMDPRLFDLIWSVYQKSGSSDYINVLCGYRAPGTNEMLRNRSRHTGVAKESQHILGKAMDFYIPGVPLERLREIGLKLQMGGVGYYPTSGSPFVHMDVGGVRAWPRASRETLVRLFPDGKTIHIPPDGKPLPGYEAAMADYKRRLGSNNIEIASSGGGRKNLFQMLFGGGGDEDESPEAIADTAPAKAQPPKAAPAVAATPVQVATAEPAPQPKQTFIENLPGTTVANAPVPNVRPSMAGQNADLETALVSPARSSASAAMASVLQPPDAGNGDYADLGDYKIPVPQLLGERKQPGEAELAAVPLPGMRPDYQVASAAPDLAVTPSAVPMPAPQAADAGGNAPKPTNAPGNGSDEIAAMIRRMSGDDAAAPAAATPVARPQQVALAEPSAAANKQLTRSLKADIRPALTEAYQPKKGARPNKTDAIAALRGSHSQPAQLTGEMIEKWALAANNAQIVAPKPAEGANARDRDADAKPAAVASSQADTAGARFDPARFSGAAPVAKTQ